MVGGGKVAERKALALLRAGARLKVISPVLTEGLKKKKSSGGITHVQRRFRESDLKGAFLVVAATDDEGENEKIARQAGLVNVVDRPELCSFIVPSSIKRGPLQIAISTSGISPAISKAIRKELEALYGPAFGKYLMSLKGLRRKAIMEMGKKDRESFLKSLASGKILAGLRK